MKGGVPDEWRTEKLGEVIELVSGQHVEAALCNDVGEGVGYLTGPSDFEGKKIKVTKFTTAPRVFSKPGDILVTVKGSGTGRMALSNGKYAISRQLMAIRAKFIDSNFLFQLLLTLEESFSEAADGLIPGITRSDVVDTLIALPPLPEQRRIAAILSQWDDSLSILSRLIEAKRQQKRGLAEALLTGKRRLPGFEGEWESVPVREAMPPKAKEFAGEEDYPIMSVTVTGLKLQEDHFNKRIASERTNHYIIVRRNEIAMSGLNFWMGAIGMQTTLNAAIISPDYKVFRVNEFKFDHDFAKHFVRSRRMLQILLDCSVQRASLVRRNLQIETFLDSLLSLPPLPEQRAVASVLSTLDEEISALERLRASVQAQKRGLMDLLLTGKVRVGVEAS